MSTRKTMASPTSTSIASYVRKSAGRVKKIQKLHHGKIESVREADYQGHHIVVRTSYNIEVDGKMIMGHMGVTNDGQVHYHPVPNMSFPSAIDMVKTLIDIFPDDFAATSMGNKGSIKRRKTKSRGARH